MNFILIFFFYFLIFLFSFMIFLIFFVEIDFSPFFIKIVDKKLSLPPKPLLGADKNSKKKKNIKIRKGLMTNYFFLNVEIVFSIGFLKKRFLYFFSIRFVSCFLKPSLWTEPNQILPHPDLLMKIIKFAKIFLSIILLPLFFSKECKMHFNH